MALRVTRIEAAAQLAPSLRKAWSQLGIPTPMQSPNWLLGWWEMFADPARDRLCLLLIYDAETLVAVVPWYLSQAWMGGCRLRFLGDAVTCSDHSTLLIRPGYEVRVGECLVEWLLTEAEDSWHSIQWDAIDSSDAHINAVLQRLADHGLEIHGRETAGCWTVDLPGDWEDYLSGLSKSHRKRCRRWQRDYFDGGRAKIIQRSADDFQLGWRCLAELNVDRREVVGDRSAFADPSFRAFHQKVLPGMLAQGEAELRELHVDGACRAVEYVLKRDDTLFCYQSGMQNSESRDGFGNLSILALFRKAIAGQVKRIDFLRGDEPYKARWGAHREPCKNYHVTSKSLRGLAQSTFLKTAYWARDARTAFLNPSPVPQG